MRAKHRDREFAVTSDERPGGLPGTELSLYDPPTDVVQKRPRLLGPRADLPFEDHVSSPSRSEMVNYYNKRRFSASMSRQ